MKVKNFLQYMQLMDKLNVKPTTDAAKRFDELVEKGEIKIGG